MKIAGLSSLHPSYTMTSPHASSHQAIGVHAWCSLAGCHGNFWAGSNGADSESTYFSLSHRWGPEAWWALPGTDLTIGGKSGSLLACP